MPTIIQHLAQEMVERIRKKQNWRTMKNRRLGLQNIQTNIHESDEALKIAVYKANLMVRDGGGFGLSNSYFLKATEGFLQQAEQCFRRGEQNKPANRKLAEEAIQHLGQSILQDVKHQAYQTTWAELAWATQISFSAYDVIKKAEAHRNQIQKNYFAFWRWRKDREMIDKLDLFISQAKYLRAQFPAPILEEEIVVEVKAEVVLTDVKVTQTLASLRPTPQQLAEYTAKQNAKYIDNASEVKKLLEEFDQAEQNQPFINRKNKIEDLQKEIDKHIQANKQKFPILHKNWQHWYTNVAPNEVENIVFFENNKKYLDQIPALLQPIDSNDQNSLSLIEKYKQLVTDKAYLAYLQQRNELRNAPPSFHGERVFVLETAKKKNRAEDFIGEEDKQKNNNPLFALPEKKSEPPKLSEVDLVDKYIYLSRKENATKPPVESKTQSSTLCRPG